MKHLPLALLVFANSAFAQVDRTGDSIEQQISITRDAVNITLEEIQQRRSVRLDSADSDEKTRQLDDALAAALTEFEREVREDVIEPFSVLVNQYNVTHADALRLGDSTGGRATIKETIYRQLTLLAKEKEDVYTKAFLKVYQVLPKLPLMYSVTTNSEKRTCKIDQFNTDRLTTYNVRYVKNENGYEGCFEHLLTFQRPTTEQVKARLLEGCYTQSCFFQTHALITLYHSSLQSRFAKALTIRLNDDYRTVTINNHGRLAKSYDRDGLTDLLTGTIGAPALWSSVKLPLTLKEDRLSVLSSFESDVTTGRLNCKAGVARFQQDVCATTGGCLKAEEKSLLKSRGISCL